MSEILVREAQVADLAMVVHLENRSFSDPWTPAALLGELQPDDLRVPLVAEIEGTVCGYLMAWRMVDQLHILNIATDPAYLRRGIGSALLLAAAREALRSGQGEISLEVRQGNTPAREFYRHHHFVEMGVRAGYYRDNGEDAIIMTASTAALLG